MPVKGLDEVRKNVNKLFAKISGPVTEDVVTEILITGLAYASAITPRDTALLVNSQFKILTKIDSGWLGKVGFVAEYADFVHEASGKLKGQPRSSVKSFETSSGKTAFASNEGNFWDPYGEPQFLKKGFERDGKEEIKNIIIRGYKNI
ncbi:Uncharacterised protein [Yersinia frederiksenii]|nr:Uncharacterised protein [Yersinia frederiksenii]